ncbi:MAG: hypothetical protein WCG27_06440, partial [Pseudomonadota bacterium]
MKLIIFTLIILELCLPQITQAEPDKVEFWFLKEEQIQAAITFLEKKSPIFSFSPPLAENSNDENCVPMGEGCFNPQTGFIPKKVTVLKDVPADHGQAEPQVKTFNAIETDLISCDKNYYFDIFCGQSTEERGPAEVKRANLEVWIDTTDSLRLKDYDPNSNCYRRKFVEALQKQCDGAVSTLSYNNFSLKETTEPSDFCINYGQNDGEKLEKWVKDRMEEWKKEPKVPHHLVVITDLEEQNDKTLDETGAKTKGLNST